MLAASLRLLNRRLADVAHARLRDVLVEAPLLRLLSPALRGEFGSRGSAFRDEMRSADARSSLVGHMARGMTDYLTREHQYLRLDRDVEAVLADLYARLIGDLGAATSGVCAGSRFLAGAETALADHQDRLKSFIEPLLDEAGALERARSGSPPSICAHYDPDLQLRLLGLDPRGLTGPVLDLGCGADGALVRHLRGLGRSDAFGIDRAARGWEGIFRGSWFEAPLPERSWGTVVSHQSFSLHFVQAHLSSPARATEYAHAYMRVLGSLKPGGTFAYAPGLPFVEALLDGSEWEVRSRPVLDLGPTAPAPIRILYGSQGMTAVQVRRNLAPDGRPRSRRSA